MQTRPVHWGRFWGVWDKTSGVCMFPGATLTLEVDLQGGQAQASYWGSASATVQTRRVQWGRIWGVLSHTATGVCMLPGATLTPE